MAQPLLGRQANTCCVATLNIKEKTIRREGRTESPEGSTASEMSRSNTHSSMPPGIKRKENKREKKGENTEQEGEQNGKTTAGGAKGVNFHQEKVAAQRMLGP